MTLLTLSVTIDVKTEPAKDEMEMKDFTKEDKSSEVKSRREKTPGDAKKDPEEYFSLKICIDNSLATKIKAPRKIGSKEIFLISLISQRKKVSR